MAETTLEKLARHGYTYLVPGGNAGPPSLQWDQLSEQDRKKMIFAVRAILQELLEPTIDTIWAGIGPMKAEDEEQAGRTFIAMLNYILNEDNDDKT